MTLHVLAGEIIQEKEMKLIQIGKGKVKTKSFKLYYFIHKGA